MADLEAVKIVKEALGSGRTEKEVIGFLKAAGYPDDAISDIMSEAKGVPEPGEGPAPAPLPKLGPPELPSQQPAAQPKPSKISRKWLIIIAAFIVIVAIALVLWFFNPFPLS